MLQEIHTNPTLADMDNNMAHLKAGTQEMCIIRLIIYDFL